ncbi:NADP-dependent malic enzyme-like [Solanum stenotomum]|uniref:NADP-dependent malic enzyme-like n=1 Tax=Solanum stenotomum TaxID=172797 RepID=UPI0020D0F16A|nr:NADP-dependent malic enzyme-like [Solanum stenotomum]
MKVVKQIYGEKVLVQYEDFANHNAFELLVKYGTTHLVFNDDIQVCCFSFGLIPLMLQGTAVVVLAGLVASLKLLGGSLVEHTFLFFGAGEQIWMIFLPLLVSIADMDGLFSLKHIETILKSLHCASCRSLRDHRLELV